MGDERAWVRELVQTATASIPFYRDHLADHDPSDGRAHV